MRINKFIINNNELILGYVEYHYQLIGDRKRYDTVGGGRWEYQPEEFGEIIFFFGKSSDFGPVTKSQFDAAWEIAKTKPEFAEYVNAKVIFSNYEYLFDVLLEHNIQYLGK